MKAHATTISNVALTPLASEFLILHPSFAVRVTTLYFDLLIASAKVKFILTGPETYIFLEQ